MSSRWLEEAPYDEARRNGQRTLTRRPICRWCGGEVPRPRRSWCSDACVHEYKLRADAGYVRAMVFDRDKGACAVCGLDTPALARLLARRPKTQLTHGVLNERMGFAVFGVSAAMAKRDKLMGIPVSRLRLWDLDHIVPVNEGGGQCGLDGYQTLCLWCHRTKTVRYNQELHRRKKRSEVARSRGSKRRRVKTQRKHNGPNGQLRG